MKKIIAIILACMTFMSCIVVASASDVVVYDDGRSYNGLPEFPTSTQTNYVNSTKYYVKLTEYVLYFSSSENKYYLLCFNGENGSIYLNDKKFKHSGKFYKYTDSAMTSYSSATNGSYIFIYTCNLNDTSWTFKERGSEVYYGIDYKDTLLQTSASIYTDSALNKVFTEPTMAQLMWGMSSANLNKTMMMEMVGLVPSAIGLVVLVTAFWMGWRLLRQELLMV